MIQNTVHVRASRAKVRRALSNLPHYLVHESSPVTNAMMTRVGMAVLGRIREAFVVKARGGIDDAGESWQPLSPRTIANRRGGRTRAEKKRPVRPSQALNKKQQDQWWEVYRRQLARFKGDKGHAAAVAWIVLKASGAQTLVDKYGHRKVEILRDTGVLLNSLSPGVPSAERIFRVGPGEVIIGTNRKGASGHHKGIPGRLPQRRLWAPPSRWPRPWWQDVLDEVKQGISDAAAEMAKGAA